MKTDRLIAITTYLLNHGLVSASELAERFEVSRRTIQRDMDALSLAGIPIIAEHGPAGGYQLLDGFRLAKQAAGDDDSRNIITALRGLFTASADRRVEDTLEKALSTLPPAQQRVFVDLSAAREGSGVDKCLRVIEHAIAAQSPLRMSYMGAEGVETDRVVEPLALSYRWYAWYLFAFCRLRQAYRLFKLPRMARCEAVAGHFSREHGEVEAMMREAEARDSREALCVRLLCRPEVRRQALEYLGSNIVEERPDGSFVLERHVPMERMWFSLILGFGDRVEVLSPEAVRTRVRDMAREISSVYA